MTGGRSAARFISCYSLPEHHRAARTAVQNGESSVEASASWQASLALVEVFRDLPAQQLAELERQLVALPIRRGEILFRQGDPEDALYIVGSGRFAVDVGDRRIAEIGVGAPIGEIAFFADRKRTATVTA